MKHFRSISVFATARLSQPTGKHQRELGEMLLLPGKHSKLLEVKTQLDYRRTE